MANMNVEQMVTANGNGVIISTRITCGVLYQSEYIIPFDVMTAMPNIAMFLESEKLREARKVFSEAWKHVSV